MNSKYLYLTTSLFCKIGINLFVVFYLAKKLTLIDFGSFSLAFVFSALFISLFDYGFNLKSLVLAGKDFKEINRELSLMISSKILVTLLFSIIFVLFLYNSGYDIRTSKTVLILVGSSIPISFGNFFLNSFKIFRDFKKEAIGFVLQTLLISIFIILNTFFGKNDIIIYASIIAFARTVYFIYALVTFKSKFLPTLNFRPKKIIKTLKNTTPYAIHLILSSSIIYIDTFILSFLSDLNNVGLYQAGMRVVIAGMLIAVILNDAFIPEISSLSNQKKIVTQKMSKLFEFVLFFGLLTSIFILFYKNTIITLLFSEDFLVLNTFIYYIISILFLRYIGIVPGIVLTSFNKQKIRANALVIAVIASVFLNWFLIPIFGIEGAFISSLCAHIILNIIYICKSYTIIQYIKKNKNYFSILVTTLLNLGILKFFLKDNLLNLVFSVLLNLVLLALYTKQSGIYKIFKPK